MKQNKAVSVRTIRSFVIREGRFTEAQKKAFHAYWPAFGINIDTSTRWDFGHYFPVSQPLILDIGFGNGESLISLAQQREDFNFIGVEVYRPGIGVALQKINQLGLSNIRIIHSDILNIMPNIDENSFAGIIVWFPDPWPKKRHHKRRLVQKTFIQQACRIIKPGGILHIASDWRPYVEYIQEQANQVSQISLLSAGQHPLGLLRPHTRFEQRGLRKGHKVTDLIYQISKI